MHRENSPVGAFFYTSRDIEGSFQPWVSFFFPSLQAIFVFRLCLLSLLPWKNKSRASAADGRDDRLTGVFDLATVGEGRNGYGGCDGGAARLSSHANRLYGFSFSC